MRTPNVNRQHTSPVSWPKSKRGFPIEVGTSLPAGKVVPVFATTLLRQDSLKAHVNFNIEMLETKELLANPVRARVSAYLVPELARERFQKSRDQFDRSYMGQPQVDGGSVVDYFDFEQIGAAGADKIYQYLGFDDVEGNYVETGYAEAYNLIQNFRLRNRSRDVYADLERSRTDTSLAQAFWDLGRFSTVLPSFDQALAEGEVALNVVQAQLPVTGIGFTSAPGQAGPTNVVESKDGGTTVSYDAYRVTDLSGIAIDATGTATNAAPEIFAEMQENGITISLANIEMAKKLQSFAKVRERYTALSDDDAEEYIIDMLMAGIRIPDQALMQPILLKQQTMTFSQGKRYASDSGNLDDSAVSGFAGGSMSIRVPEVDTGGIVMVIVECFPQQLFERQADPRFNCYQQVQALSSGQPQTDILPEAMRDHLDPEKVDVVFNREIATDHSLPNDKMGYAPMNWRWNSNGPRLGGKFHQGVAISTDRKRFWAAETVDPELGQDFYMVPADLQTDVFLNNGDPFECFMGGSAEISGNTQFGGLLIEQTENYETLESQAEVERIDQEAT